MKKQIFITFIVFSCASLCAQDYNPFREYGYTPKIATLSKGKYIEHFDRDTIVRIGTVLFNTKSKEIVSFVKRDTSLQEYAPQPGLVSRWISPDPLAAEAPGWTPYRFAFNNPVYWVDPDGLFESTHIDEEGNVIAEYDDGDDGVYVHAMGTTRSQIDEQRNGGEFTGGEGNYIGELGGNIDMNITGLFKGWLTETYNTALEISWADWVNTVKQYQQWDLKNNLGTIWGVAWKFDQSKPDNEKYTSFSFLNYNFSSAADVGNYHAGFSGVLVGVPVPAQKIGAGGVEQLKDLNRGDYHEVWQQYWSFGNTFMDNKVDYHWNTTGMGDAKWLMEEIKKENY